MGRSRRSNGRDNKKDLHKIFLIIISRRNLLGYIYVHGIIILKQVLQNYYVKMWIGII
jgi:hypothetical protein